MEKSEIETMKESGDMLEKSLDAIINDLISSGKTEIKWIDVRDTGIDPLELYHRFHENETRGELSHSDHQLYEYLRLNRKLEEIPTKLSRKYGDPAEYVETHFPDSRRSDIRRIERSLYYYLHKKKKIDCIASNYNPNEDTLAIYTEKYNGKTRGELYHLDQAVYQKLRRKGLMGFIPGDPDRNIDYLQRYHEQCEGMTRGEVRENFPSTYEGLRKNNLLKDIPLKKEQSTRKQSTEWLFLIQEYAPSKKDL